MLLVTKVPKEGEPYDIALNKRNVLEVTPKAGGDSWIKYWDGTQVRTAIITETPAQVATQ